MTPPLGVTAGACPSAACSASGFYRRGWIPGRSRVATKAEKGDGSSRSFEGGLLGLLEENLVIGRDSVEKLPLDDTPPQMQQVLKGWQEGGLEKLDVLLDLTRAARKRILQGEEVYLEQFIEDFLREVTPSVPLIFAMLRAGQSVVVVLVLGWLWSLIEVDAWRYCRMPETSLLSWVAWTVPYVACTLVFWQDWILEDYLPVKGYKFAQRSFMEEDVTSSFLKNASIVSLSLESFFRSLTQVFISQGCYYGALSVLFLGPVETVITMPDNFAGSAQQIILPRAFRSVQAVGALGLLLSLQSVLQDPSIFTYLLNDVSKLIGGAPLSSIYSDEDYNMVMESQVMEGQTALTAVLGGTQAIYLASEMLATNSLYTSVCTSAIGMLIFSLAVKRNMVEHEPS